METILLTDGYKLDHRRQYPEGTEYVYSNWTPRSNHYYPEADDGVVVFGIQYLVKKYFIDDFKKNFFDLPKKEAVDAFERRVFAFIGPNRVGRKHIEDLHDLGYLPIEVKALPEGSLCPIRVPCMTVINTLPEFFWVTNYLETLLSCVLWMPMTSATTARLFKRRLMEHLNTVGLKLSNTDIGFLCHDFSMRGMAGIESAIISGLGHLTSFNGSETIPASEAAEKYYNINADTELVSATIGATEHSVMCAGGMEDEFRTFKRLITEVYPDGFVSIVSDTWDFWKVIDEYMPALKDIIMARNGRVVIRPDSGDPVDIVAGLNPADVFEFNGKKYYVEGISTDAQTEHEISKLRMSNPDALAKYEVTESQVKGAYERLCEIFGYTVNEKGYKILDGHVGMIYGDSINLDRQNRIYQRLEAKYLTSSNLCLGVGSFSYQLKSRDSLGFAMKATWCQINGQPKEIFKHPKTDSGMKNSLKGLICVKQDDNGKYYAVDQVSKEEEENSCLTTVFKDGVITRETSLADIRARVNESIENYLRAKGEGDGNA